MDCLFFALSTNEVVLGFFHSAALLITLGADAALKTTMGLGTIDGNFASSPLHTLRSRLLFELPFAAEYHTRFSMLGAFVPNFVCAQLLSYVSDGSLLVVLLYFWWCSFGDVIYVDLLATMFTDAYVLVPGCGL